MAAMLARVARRFSRLCSPVSRSTIEVIFLLTQKATFWLWFHYKFRLFVLVSDGKILCRKSKKRSSRSSKIFRSFICGKFTVYLTRKFLKLIDNYLNSAVFICFYCFCLRERTPSSFATISTIIA